MDDTNEAISAVVEDAFIAEDDDEDDYEDLYNDVNVGENFLQSVNNRTDDVAVPQPESLPPPPPIPPEKEPEVKIARVSDPVEEEKEKEAKKVEDRGDDVAEEGKVAMRINVGQQPNDQDGNFSNQVAVSNSNNNNTSLMNARQASVSVNVNVNVNVNGGGGGGGGMLFVGDLQWWTTDAELEAELCKYGAVKEVRFFDEKASGKSKGYAQVEFYDQASASACKEGMNGFVFNGRPCVVAFASPFSVRRMGEAQVNRGPMGAAQGGGGLGPVRKDGNLGNNNVNNGKTIGNNVASYQDNNNNSGGGNNSGFGNRGGFGRGNWGRGNGGRGGPIRGRPMMGRGMMGNNGFGTGPPMLPPQAMMGQGFDPTFPMGRMAGYGGFPGGPNPPFNGMMSSFPAVGGVGLPGVAPHVNPAFFGRGMGMNGMGMMSSSGVEGANMGMWNDPNMGGWGGEEHGGRVAESSYAEEAVSDQYGEVSRGRPNAMKEKDRGGEREWSGSSDKRYNRDDREPEYERETPRDKEAGHDQEWQERRHRDDRDVSRERERERSRDRGRDRHRDERERYVDHHRYKDREPEYDDEWERGRSSRGHNKSRLSQEEGQHFRSRESDYSKKRRLTSE